MLGKYQRCISCMKEIGTNNVCPYCGYIEGSPYLPAYLPPKTVLNQRYIVGKLLSYNGEGAAYIAFDTVVEAAVEIREYMPDALCDRAAGGTAIVVNPGCETKYKALMSDFVDLMHRLTRMRTLPTVVQAYEVFEQNNTVYAVFEHVEGGTLRQYLNENAGEISWEQASKLFLPLFNTLTALHASGLVHRGISPETILVNSKGEIKLNGFSISSLRAANTELSPQLFGGYAAPEQYSSNSWHGTWTDVYALSAVIYKSLTGTMPPEATTRSVNDNLIAPNILNPDVPRHVSNALMAGLLMSSEQRTQTVMELKNELYSPAPTAAAAVTKKAPAPEIEIKQEEEEKKKGLPSWAIALIITSAALLVVLAVLLIFLFSGSGGGNTSSLVDSSVSSEASAPASSVESVESTAGTSSVSMNDYALEDFSKQRADSVTQNPTYTAKYKFKVVQVWDESLAAGYIVRQEPAADTPVALNTEVTLYVSQGPQFIKVPEHNNRAVAEYEAELIRSGISKERYEIQYENHDGITEGYVIRTSMDGASYDMAGEEKLIIYVSQGPAVPSEPSEPDASSSDPFDWGFGW